jgi:hypothetical protein
MLANKAEKSLIKASETFNEVLTLFDNLMTMEEFLLMLKHQYCRRTIYRWISQGMPHKQIRKKLWFPKNASILRLERSSN